ncbi:hypothetical protein AABB24_006684 [Solanum stoloniferum]|uniref:F-box domain-containing protein n=1 Tax=Solanum stoloniferum TaxID=62892 RepID=A0ABD2V2N5_9SOLN
MRRRSKTNRRRRVVEKKKKQFFFKDLSDELLIEILIRLPSSKEATLCKSVCKRWFALISSDDFRKISLIHYRNCDKKTLIPFTFVSIDYNYFHYLTDDTDLYVSEFCPENGFSRRVNSGFLNSDLPPMNYISLIESCGDLILCSGGTSDRIDYYIANVLTKQWFLLPRTLPRTPLESNTRFMSTSERVGFLIEPSSVDNAPCQYLVLRFISWGDSKFSIHVFSSKKGNWTRMIVTSPRNLNMLSRRTSIVACGRMFYTFIYERNDVVDCVLAFDPFTNDPSQILSVIDFPPEARDKPCLTCKLGVCGGRLRFAQIVLLPSRYLYPCISIWELEDDYRTGKWTLVHQRVPTDTVFRVPTLATKWVSVLTFHPYNEDLICFLVGNDHIVYNIQTDKVESSTLTSLFKKSLNVHVVPITRNWWPTSL